MLKLSFKQTQAEFMVRVASSLIFNKLVEAKFPVVAIRDVTENVQYGYTEKAAKEEIGPKYVRITDLQDGQINWETVPYCKCEQPEQYLLSENDLLFARTGATTGKTHLVRENPPNAVFASYLIRVRPQKSINPEYLYSFFQSDLYWSQVSDQKEGSAQPNVNGQKLSNIQVPIVDKQLQTAINEFLAVVRLRQDGFDKELPELPSPLTEQRRIVAHIEALAARVAAAQSLRREADNETELLLAAQLKNIRHKLLESNYPKKKFGDIAQVTSGGTPSRDNLSYWGGNIPWIKTGELVDGDIFEAEEHITEEGMKNSSAKLFPPETILIALYGQGQTRGRTARLMIEATTNQACCAILPTPEILEPRFTQYWQRSLYYEMREKSHGGAQPNWNGGMIKNVEIALPSLEEQRQLVAYLDGLQAQVSALRAVQAETERELSALMPSVLDRAFKGEL